MAKSEGAFLTIGELAAELGLPQHILRYWETRFPQLRPLQRAGNRRYYRPADVVLARRIDTLLNREGYTVKGVQQLLASDAGKDTDAGKTAAAQEKMAASGTPPPPANDLAELRAIRAMLSDALKG